MGEEIDAIVRLAILEILGDEVFDSSLADAWTDRILERSLQRISALGRPFKYIATCVLSKQTDSILDTAATAFWDTHSDSLCCTRKGNGSIDCIVTIYSCRR